MTRRSARQRAASRANLIKARASRRRKHHLSPKTRRRVRRTAKTVGIVGLVAAGGYAASRNKKVNVVSKTMASSTRTVTHNAASPHRVRSKTFKKANYAHTPEAKAHANIRYRHSSGIRKPISEAEVMRRTSSYSAIRGKRITSMERDSVMRKYRKQTI